MNVEQALKLKPGDKIHHLQMPDLCQGTFVRLEGPYEFAITPRVDPVRTHYRIWWKGWEEMDRDREDWTWEWAVGEGHPK